MLGFDGTKITIDLSPAQVTSKDLSTGQETIEVVLDEFASFNTTIRVTISAKNPAHNILIYDQMRNKSFEKIGSIIYPVFNNSNFFITVDNILYTVKYNVNADTTYNNYVSSIGVVQFKKSKSRSENRAYSNRVIHKLDSDTYIKD